MTFIKTNNNVLLPNSFPLSNNDANKQYQLVASIDASVGSIAPGENFIVSIPSTQDSWITYVNAVCTQSPGNKPCLFLVKINGANWLWLPVTSFTTTNFISDNGYTPFTCPVYIPPNITLDLFLYTQDIGAYEMKIQILIVTNTP
jgi:hypothetical protein